MHARFFVAPAEAGAHLMAAVSRKHRGEEEGLFRPLPSQADNVLRETMQLQADKVTIARRAECGPIIGHLDAQTRGEPSRRIAVVTGLAA
jgi:hypothetical protein